MTPQNTTDNAPEVDLLIPGDVPGIHQLANDFRQHATEISQAHLTANQVGQALSEHWDSPAAQQFFTDLQVHANAVTDVVNDLNTVATALDTFANQLGAAQTAATNAANTWVPQTGMSLDQLLSAGQQQAAASTTGPAQNAVIFALYSADDGQVAASNNEFGDDTALRANDIKTREQAWDTIAPRINAELAWEDLTPQQQQAAVNNLATQLPVAGEAGQLLTQGLEMPFAPTPGTIVAPSHPAGTPQAVPGPSPTPPKS